MIWFMIHILLLVVGKVDILVLSSPVSEWAVGCVARSFISASILSRGRDLDKRVFQNPEQTRED
jgi:hypothetical protein